MPSMVASTLFARPANICLLVIFTILTIFYFNPAPYLYNTTHDALAASPQPHDWLIATISPALAQRRRNMIRTTWQTLYTGPPPATFRFVIANPGEEWLPLLRHEYDTYGDLVMLEHLTESKELGMRTKELDFMLWLLEQGDQYKFVSKLDDDSYLDASAFYEEFLEARVNAAATPDQEKPVIIGRRLGQGGTISLQFPFPYPGGQFYTLSWSVVEALARQYNVSNTRHEFADVLIGMLLDEAGTEFEFIDMSHAEAFELEEGKMDEEAWEHDITDKSVNPHLLKEDDVFMRVAEEMKSVKRRKQWWKDEQKWEWDVTEERKGKTSKESTTAGTA